MKLFSIGKKPNRALSDDGRIQWDALENTEQCAPVLHMPASKDDVTAEYQPAPAVIPDIAEQAPQNAATETPYDYTQQIQQIMEEERQLSRRPVKKAPRKASHRKLWSRLALTGVALGGIGVAGAAYQTGSLSRFFNNMATTDATPPAKVAQAQTTLAAGTITPLAPINLDVSPADRCITTAINHQGERHDSQSGKDIGHYFAVSYQDFTAMAIDCKNKTGTLPQGYVQAGELLKNGERDLIARIDGIREYNIIGVAMPGAVDTLMPVSARAVIKTANVKVNQPVQQIASADTASQPVPAVAGTQLNTRIVRSVTVRPDGTILSPAPLRTPVSIALPRRDPRGYTPN